MHSVAQVGRATLGAAMLLTAAAACHPGRRALAPETVPTGASSTRLITRRRIEASGAHTAWEALQRTVPHFDFQSDSRGRAVGIAHRGRDSILLHPQPLVLLDDVPLTDVQVLDGIPASDLEAIEVLSGIEATTYYGTNAGKGAIRIHTRTGSS